MAPLTHTQALDRLEALLASIDPEENRVVVRWAEESRVLPDSEDPRAFAVGPVAYVILTAKVDGTLVQERFDGVSIAQVRHLMGRYPLQPLFRSDNITC